MVAPRERCHTYCRQRPGWCLLSLQTGEASPWDSPTLEHSRPGTAPQMPDVMASVVVSVLETIHEGKMGSRDVAPASGPSCDCPPLQGVEEQGLLWWANPKVPPPWKALLGLTLQQPKDGSGAEEVHEAHSRDLTLPRTTKIGCFLLHHKQASDPVSETFSCMPAFLCSSIPIVCLT